MEGEADKQTQSGDIRLQQVENAVNFLSHPKVRDSSESSKRSFLVGKGLTDAEISEAFRRVPQSAIQDRPLEPVVTLQPKQQPEGYSWTTVALGLGFTAAAVYSIKSLLGPSISKTIQSWRSSKDEHESIETDSSIEGASGELAKAVREQTEQMRQSLESLENFIRSQSALDSQKEDSISQLRDEVRHLTEKLDRETTAEEIESNRSPMSYMEVLEMLEKGETPPGIRDDIDDKPPNPTMSPPISKLKPLPKPWQSETNQTSSFRIDEMEVPSEGDATTPNRRDLSGQRATSIYQSIESTPEKNPSVLVEQVYSRDEQMGSGSPSLSGSIKIDGSLGRKMMKNWRPPPLPTPSLSSPDASSTT